MKKVLEIGFGMGLLLFSVEPGLAGEADIIDAEITSLRPGVFDFKVTVRHQDEGWHHFLDRWEVLSPEGKVLGTRSVRFPHVSEQPFTLILFDVGIEEGTDLVEIRAHDSLHGYGGETLKMPLPW
jgi:hypothetical protein